MAYYNPDINRQFNTDLSLIVYATADKQRLVHDYYSCETWAEVYGAYIANKEDTSKFEFYSNFTNTDQGPWPCSYWLPTNVYDNCIKVKNNFMNFN